VEIALRPARPDDTPFLHEVYASTRAEELAGVPWDDATRIAFLRTQAELQDADYRRRHPSADFLVVVADGADAGRLYRVLLGDAELRLLDLALLPAWRGRGIGSRLVEELAEDCRLLGRLLSLHVEHHNPARRLYERAGLVAVAEDGVTVRMERDARAS
jgi:ribosomal protein S18 acetylase RimI-like enzyme